jgi:hypothetical protein
MGTHSRVSGVVRRKSWSLESSVGSTPRSARLLFQTALQRCLQRHLHRFERRSLGLPWLFSGSREKLRSLRCCRPLVANTRLKRESAQRDLLHFGERFLFRLFVPKMLSISYAPQYPGARPSWPQSERKMPKSPKGGRLHKSA